MCTISNHTNTQQNTQSTTQNITTRTTKTQQNPANKHTDTKQISLNFLNKILVPIKKYEYTTKYTPTYENTRNTRIQPESPIQMHIYSTKILAVTAIYKCSLQCNEELCHFQRLKNEIIKCFNTSQTIKV